MLYDVPYMCDLKIMNSRIHSREQWWPEVAVGVGKG